MTTLQGINNLYASLTNQDIYEQPVFSKKKESSYQNNLLFPEFEFTGNQQGQKNDMQKYMQQMGELIDQFLKFFSVINNENPEKKEDDKKTLFHDIRGIPDFHVAYGIDLACTKTEGKKN